MARSPADLAVPRLEHLAKCEFKPFEVGFAGVSGLCHSGEQFAAGMGCSRRVVELAENGASDGL